MLKLGRLKQEASQVVLCQHVGTELGLRHDSVTSGVHAGRLHLVQVEDACAARLLSAAMNTMTVHSPSPPPARIGSATGHPHQQAAQGGTTSL